MQQISNKTLTLLLLTAIVVSIAGTIISINKVNQLIPQAPIITGMGTGMVNVSIAATTSISAIDTQIDFASCAPTATYGCNATSNYTTDNTFGCGCSGGSAPDNITVKNSGNRHLNVTVAVGTVARSFVSGDLGGTGQAEMWFISRNSTDAPGCYNLTVADSNPPDFDPARGLQWAWKNVSLAATNYAVCNNLTYGTTTNSIYFFVKLFIPANSPPTEKNTTLTFTGTNW